MSSPSCRRLLRTLNRLVRSSTNTLKLMKQIAYHKTTKAINDLSIPLPSLEIAQQLEHVFSLIDANGDGKISSTELRHLLRRLGHPRSSASSAAREMLREADDNGDGFIDLTEFLEITAKVGGGFGTKEDLMEAFSIFDRDKNGLISAKELQRVLRGLGDYKSTIHDCVSMIRGVDRNGDGQVDFEEFKVMMMGDSHIRNTRVHPSVYG
ncbi:calmodulin [Amborella trichopoda]|uniref:EF-hand domain-containing protein n=1 Tax=Amborella trichopoda TaxID=13333 RepID=W1PZ29_AMBTC|nr:calmodulin [Amborella trichopoda]ERN13276.1 hypothetical protein AMTR_s00041p00030040 [Amborella trichopoda]|eukprot:XP_006851809.1 calmodulin [Amborella trichopoda]